jgi:V/A-type H+/Na+-transporting ATPase subunit D
MGRLWLLSRLELAERAVSLLEEKLRVLSELHGVLLRRAAQTRRDWEEACRAADVWGLRASLLGGQRTLEMATTCEQASVTIQWAAAAGTRYPDHALCALPSGDEPIVVYTSSATVLAAGAYRTAVLAVAGYAAAQSALDTIERELHATRLRARALSRHWLPAMRDELAGIELQLEEQERAEAIRMRLVDQRQR